MIVVNGLADLLTNAIGSFEWISNLKGKEKYGEKFQKVPDHNFVVSFVTDNDNTQHTGFFLQHDKNLGLYRQLKYSNGAKLGFLQVRGQWPPLVEHSSAVMCGSDCKSHVAQVYGGHYLIEDQPRGMHLAFQHFLSWT